MKKPIILFLACCALANVAHARGYAPAIAKNSTGFEVKFASNGTPIAAMSNTATGVAVGSAIALPLTSSVLIQAAGTGAISGAAAGGAWGAALGAMGAVALLAVPALLDAYQRAKIRIEPASGQLQAVSNSVCPARSPTTEAPTNPSYSAASWFSTEPNGLFYNGQKNTYGCAYGWQWKFTPDPTDPSTFYKQQRIDLIESPGAATDSFTSITPAIAVERMTAIAPTQQQVQALVDLNFPPEVSPPVMTGPARQFMGNTVELLSPDEKKTVDSWATFDYTTPGVIGVTTEVKTTVESPTKKVTTTVTSDGVNKTTVTTNPDGSTTSVFSPVTSSDKTEYTPAKKEKDTCGMPGTPACKIDETDTPKFDPKTMQLDKATLDAASKTQRETVSSTSDKASMFNPFAQFFTLPPLSSCTPIVMPMYAGQQIASMDVCPAAEWLRGLMGFVWAAAGFAFVFRTVQDVI